MQEHTANIGVNLKLTLDKSVVKTSAPEFDRVTAKTLDFARRVSIAVVMDEVTWDQVRATFAELTGLMEDAASRAVEGQKPLISAAEAKELICAMDFLMRDVDSRLRNVEVLLAGRFNRDRP